MKKIDITGERYGRFTVLKQDGVDRQGKVMWTCLCDCGEVRRIRGSALRQGLSRSCRCYARDVSSKVNAKHGAKRGQQTSPEYSTWTRMRNRCNSPISSAYGHYGGRGIKVCDRWSGEDGYINFLADMGPKPSPSYSIDRIDNDGSYSPENCRWATKKEQTRNRRVSRKVEYKNQVVTLGEIADETGIPYAILKNRIFRYQWSIERALATPVRKAQSA